MPQTFPCFNPSCSGAFTPSSEGRHPTSSYSILCLPLLFLHLARLVWISHTPYQLLGIFRWWLATEPHPWAWLGALSQLHLHPSQIKPEAGAETQTVPQGLSPGKSPGSLFHFLWSQFTGPSPCVLMTVCTESEFFPHIHSAALWYMAFLAPCLSSLSHSSFLSFVTCVQRTANGFILSRVWGMVGGEGRKVVWCQSSESLGNGEMRND